MKILFADDEIEDNYHEDWIYSELLADMEFKDVPTDSVDVVRNGQETDDMLSSNKYEGIILDIQMGVGETPPEFLVNIPRHMVGLHILKKIVKDEYKNNQKIPLVVLTGTAVAEDLRELNRIEAENSYVKICIKPIVMGNVFDELCKLKKHLSKSK